MRPFLILLAAVALLGASPRQQPASPPNPVEGAAWLKIFGIMSGSPAPVALSEEEANALLGSEQLSAIFRERGGLSGVAVELLPGEIRLRGSVEAERLGAALGPLAPPAGGPPQPVELVLRASGAGGSAEATLVRGAVAGLELPPTALAQALLGALGGVFTEQFPEGSGPELDGTSFPLPRALEGFEVGTGEILLRPAAPAP